MTAYDNGRTILRRILLREVSFAQLAVYAVGVFLGVFILSGALQLWRDFSGASSFSGDDPFAADGYIVLSPRVEGLGFSDAGFPDELLDDLRRQSWVISADRFLASGFSVTASIDFVGDRFATALFFESVPDSYISPVPAGWSFDADSPAPVIPIILPRDYLALYNFGFAPSRGLPQLGEEVMMQIPLNVSVAGNGLQRNFAARIVGFSSRINTIAVPESFLQWAGSVYGTDAATPSSRVIAHINTDSGDPEVRAFVSDRSLEIAGDDGSGGAPSRILSVILVIVSGVGALLCFLSLVVLVVSLFLLLYKSREVISRLIALGFSSVKISAVYFVMLAVVNAVVLAAVVVFLAAGSALLSPVLAGTGIPSASLWPAISFAFFVMLIVQAVGMATVKYKTRII